MNGFLIQFLAVSFLLLLIATNTFIRIPSNEYPETIVDMFFHFFVVFVGLYIVFVFVIKKDIEKETNNSFASLLDSSIISDFIRKGYDKLDYAQKKLIYDQLEILTNLPDNNETDLKKNNEDTLYTANIIIIVFGVLFLLIYLYLYFYIKADIDLRHIILTNFYMFAVSGIIEYLLFLYMIKYYKIVPASPSETIKTIVDTIKDDVANM